jgi:hypothetical protein
MRARVCWKGDERYRLRDSATLIENTSAPPSDSSGRAVEETMIDKVQGTPWATTPAPTR